MRKDFLILFLVLGLALSIFLIMTYTNRLEVDTTVWMEKKSGDGPYKLRSGNREEEEALEKAMLKALKESDELQVKETPSEHEVIFSTAKGLKNVRFHQSDRMPEVKY